MVIAVEEGEWRSEVRQTRMAAVVEDGMLVVVVVVKWLVDVFVNSCPSPLIVNMQPLY